LSKLLDNIKNAVQARREVAGRRRTQRTAGKSIVAETSLAHRDDDGPLLRAMKRSIAVDASASSVPTPNSDSHDRNTTEELGATQTPPQTKPELDAREHTEKQAEITALARARAEHEALGEFQARIIVEGSATRRAKTRAMAEQQALAAAIARAHAEAALQRQITGRIEADRAAEVIAKERTKADQCAIAAARKREAAELEANRQASLRADAEAVAQQVARSRIEAEQLAEARARTREHAEAQAQATAGHPATAEDRQVAGSLAGAADGIPPPPRYSHWSYSLRLTQFAGIAAVFSIGVGLGDWRGRNADATSPDVTAQVVTKSPAPLPGDTQLRMDNNLEQFSRHFVLRVPPDHGSGGAVGRGY
jgi:hypothetical protein